MAKKFKALREKMSPEAQQRARTKAREYAEAMALDELRVAREMTQQHLAKILGVNQAAVSKLEHRADMYVSTLQDFVRAMGGTLRIEAVFPEGRVEITQFHMLTRCTLRPLHDSKFPGSQSSFKIGADLTVRDLSHAASEPVADQRTFIHNSLALEVLVARKGERFSNSLK